LSNTSFSCSLTLFPLIYFFISSYDNNALSDKRLSLIKPNSNLYKPHPFGFLSKSFIVSS